VTSGGETIVNRSFSPIVSMNLARYGWAGCPKAAPRDTL
jgi:hypothetical protein